MFQVVPTGIGGVEGGDPEGSMDDELRWMLGLARRTPNPLTFLVMESNVDPDGWRPWFEAVHEVNAAGGNLRPQVASRCFGLLLGHESRMNPFRYAPSYAALDDLPREARTRRLPRPTRPRRDPRRGAREQPELDHPRPHPRARSSPGSSRSVTTSTTSRPPTAASPPSPHARDATRGR